MKKLLLCLVGALSLGACSTETYVGTVEYRNGDTYTIMPDYTVGDINRVEFYWDGELLGEASEMPFVYEYKIEGAKSGSHTAQSVTYTASTYSSKIYLIDVE